MSKTEEFVNLNRECVFNTYGRAPIMLVEGKGARVTDSNGKTYLDFIAGIAACPLGHGHDGLADAIYFQAKKLIHVSNLFHIEPQIKLAKILTENSFADKVFFCNSGAEANEGAIKLARKYFHDRGETSRYHIITMENSFHGRTLATLAATGQTKYRKGFEPTVEGFSQVPFGDFEMLKNAINRSVAGVLIEPIQGEGGVKIPSEGYLQNVRKLCSDTGTLLIFDEVQTGMGRTGKLFAYENYGITPDVMTLAKGIAGGVPMGALLATNQVAETFCPGNHASTFGGNPLASAAGLFVINEILSEGFLDHVIEMGNYLKHRLIQLKTKHNLIKEIRGLGLIQGIDLSVPCGDIVTIMRESGVLINCTADTVLRFIPPLVISKSEIDEMITILEDALDKIGGSMK
ncbi:MAG: acetylornithine transaminase [Syntrophaceae bacterium]|nr:acetylornithine transaminase [Syntrophaceae bacterium]